ncbi:diaminopimelate epimerase [Marinoscillum furvescens]|uniref:Diaminopimelate epimerase n=1 Tax=Marinoscillum furvescens DSM 4134 TaxID=1122208 RepID=A0A3D9LGN7_MARFU|nr:diaminopimelate epimerase [Marinoscillum furvescens]REE05860.1 diaminopimelate epimerase [Marinoscillum furvescens DSM 4134]
MQISFHKYQGTGNDFVMIDDRQRTFPEDNSEVIGFLCDRKMGVGADGVILIQEHPEHDFRMIYYNPDGSKSLCGNGSRCAIAFAKALGMIGDKTVFETTDGVHDAFIQGEIVHFHLHDVNTVEHQGNDFFIDTGSPHHVQLVEDVAAVEIVSEGSAIRYDEKYSPGGTNVNFLQQQESQISVRTYERGVEGETLSCGTGVTACALAASFLNYESPVSVETKGGQLSVSFEKKGEQHFENIYLAGPAKKVFEGIVEVPVQNEIPS